MNDERLVELGGKRVVKVAERPPARVLALTATGAEKKRYFGIFVTFWRSRRLFLTTTLGLEDGGRRPGSVVQGWPFRFRGYKNEIIIFFPRWRMGLIFRVPRGSGSILTCSFDGSLSTRSGRNNRRTALRWHFYLVIRNDGTNLMAFVNEFLIFSRS